MPRKRVTRRKPTGWKPPRPLRGGGGSVGRSGPPPKGRAIQRTWSPSFSRGSSNFYKRMRARTIKRNRARAR